MRKYFEGWYFKHQKENATLSLIPGRTEHNSFIQVITNNKSYYVPFSLEEYKKGNIVKIKNNMFTKQGCRIFIDTNELKLKGSLRYSNLTPLKNDIMGFFRFFPLECRHSVTSMKHGLSGSLSLNGETLDFNDGVGYIEGDCGCSFPTSYSWIQANDFTDELSIMVSIARIPFAGFQFWGCICAIQYMGHEYRLATYKGVKIIKRSRTKIELRQGKYRLQVEIPKQQGFRLAAPHKGEMSRTIHETPSCQARFQFWKNNTLLFDEVSNHASYEYVK